jgi:DNA-binding transcriptional MerR regulator
MANDFSGWFSTEDLISAASKEGVDVTAAQVARWHRSGLLPKPKRDYSTGQRGSVTRYPPGTLHTLLAICRVQTGRTPMGEVSWALWWNGDDRDLDDIRRHMEKVAKAIDALLAKIRLSVKRGELVKGIPVSVRDSLLKAPALRGPLGWMRRPLVHGDRDDWPIMVDLVLGTLTGNLPKFTAKHEQVVIDALHQRQAHEVTMNDHIGWAHEEHGDTFAWFADFLQRPLTERLADLSCEDLILARNETRSLLEFAVTFGEFMTWLFRPDGLGYGFMRKVLLKVIDKPDLQVFFVILVHALLVDEHYGGNIDVLHGMYEESGKLTMGHQCVMTLGNEVPGLAQIITPAAMGAAIKSASSSELLSRKIERFRADHADEIDEVIRRHPELNWGVYKCKEQKTDGP